MDKHAKKLAARSGNNEEGTVGSDGGSEVGSMTDSDSEDKVSNAIFLPFLSVLVFISLPC